MPTTNSVHTHQHYFHDVTVYHIALKFTQDNDKQNAASIEPHLTQ